MLSFGRERITSVGLHVSQLVRDCLSPLGFLGYDSVVDEELDTKAQVLDPIVCAGACNIPLLRLCVVKFVFTNIAIDIIDNIDVFISLVQPPKSLDPCSERVTAVKWADHLDTLEKTTPIAILV